MKRTARFVSVITAITLILSGMVSHAAPKAPDELAKEGSERIINAIKENKAAWEADPQKMYAFANEVILPHFDFDYMSQLVLARHWRTATENQKTRFTNAFRNMLVRTYSNALVNYQGQTIEWQPVRMEDGATDVTVRSHVIQPAGPKIPVSYSVHLVNDNWLIYDVIVDAISLVTNYRGSFNSIIRKDGLDALIERMEAKASS